jgi:hypothetical protein
MAAYRSPKPLVGVRVPGGTPYMDSSVLGTSWFAKPIYCESGNSSILFLSSSFYLSKVLSGCIRGLGPCGPGSNPGRETSYAWLAQFGRASGCQLEGRRFEPCTPHQVMRG